MFCGVSGGLRSRYSLGVTQTSIDRSGPCTARLERLVVAASSLIIEVSLEGVLERVVEVAAEVIGAAVRCHRRAGAGWSAAGELYHSRHGC